MRRPANPATDLLFGLIALQVGLIDQSQLVAGFQAWTLDKSKPLAEHLTGLGHLDAGRPGVLHADRPLQSMHIVFIVIRNGHNAAPVLLLHVQA